MNSFQPSREWRIYEIRAQRRWKENEKTLDGLKVVLYAILSVSLIWLLIHTLMALYYIFMYIRW
jgi:hypothetical protein